MQKIIAANWKMYKTRAEAASTAQALTASLPADLPHDRQVVVFAPFTCLETVVRAFAGQKGLEAGAQNFYPEPQGAFTGEISLPMLAELHTAWVLVGHSERRHVFAENDGLVARKTACALEQGFKVMLCIGETLEERESGQLAAVLSRQLSTALAPLAEPVRQSLVGKLALAYEPVWAIGTGKVAGPAEVLEAHAVVRKELQSIVGQSAAQLPILYGGSVKPANAASLLELDNVDGLLVGGASLEAESFLQIVKA